MYINSLVEDQLRKAGILFNGDARVGSVVDGDDEQFAAPAGVDHTLEDLNVVSPDGAAASDDAAPDVGWWADFQFGRDLGRNASPQDDVFRAGEIKASVILVRSCWCCVSCVLRVCIEHHFGLHHFHFSLLRIARL